MLTATAHHERWLISRDFPAVMELEDDHFPDNWTEEDYRRELRQIHCIARVAEEGETIHAAGVYLLHEDTIEITRLIGRQDAMASLVCALKGKVHTSQRKTITFAVEETNLAMQLFLKDRKFRCVGVEQDQYHFSYQAPA